jgi:hypothetical protein
MKLSSRIYKLFKNQTSKSRFNPTDFIMSNLVITQAFFKGGKVRLIR